MSLYFIAILPDAETSERVKGLKQLIAARWGPKHAFRSPAHITLMPPFEWPDKRLPVLEKTLQEFAGRQTPFEVTLSGFEAFPPRVIFVHPADSPGLAALFEALKVFLEKHLEHRDSRNNRPFKPHMTIAHRDVSPQQFSSIWEHFRDQSFTAHFTVRDLVLLKLDQDQWQVYGRFPFSG